MSDGGSITRWFDSLQAGNREAVQALWQRFASRLLGLARARQFSWESSVRRVSDIYRQVA